MDPETIALTVVLVGKIVADASFSKKALDEVTKLRVAVQGVLDDHEKRLAILEK
jgi:hypothetical protein